MESVMKKLADKWGKEIENEMERVLPRDSNIPNLYDAIWYHMETGGKRIRPLLCLATAEAFGGDIKKAMPFAAACEILHNWLLLHDDVEDGDEVRRGKPAVWIKYGLDHAINNGDVMSQAMYKLVLSSGERGIDNETVFRLLLALVETAIKTAEGQTKEFNLRKNTNPTDKEYLDMITGKTSHYLSLPLVGGAIIAGVSEDTVQRLIKFGSFIGPAFQIRDDIIDLTNGKGRNSIGSDIAEGKRSILVVHCASICTPSEKEKLFGILDKAREKTTKDDILCVKRLFGKYGSVEYAQEKAEEMVEKGKKEINAFSDEIKDKLSEIADFMVKRKI